MNFTRLTTPVNNLVNMPTLKTLTSIPLHDKKPDKIAMESASTFIHSTN